MNKNESKKAYLAWGLVCFFWGTTYLAIRIGVKTLPPALFAGIRFALAGLIFLTFLRLRGYPFPGARELLDLAAVGIALLVIANGLVVWAEQWVPSGLTALMVATMPFWMAGFEAVLPSGDKLNLRKISGILIGFSGLLLLFGADLRISFDPAYFKGILALLIAPCSWAAGSVYSKHRTFRSHPLMAAAMQMMIAGLILIFLGAFLGEFRRFAFDFQGLAALFYLLVFGSIVGFSSYTYALAKLPSSIVSMHAYINPVIAVILGWLVLNERLDWRVAAATILVLLGVILVNTAKYEKPTDPTLVGQLKAGERVEEPEENRKASGLQDN